jgi:hypothetical protein
MSADEIPVEVLTRVLTKRSKRKKIRRYVNTWKPIHTNVVYLHLQGDDDDTIREKTGFSSTAIWNILRTPEAEQIKNTVHAKVIADGLRTIPDKVASIQAIALENIASFIGNKEMAQKNPFSFFDRSVKALEVTSALQKRGHIEQDSQNSSQNPNQTNIQNNFIIAPEQSKQLLAGLPKALSVGEIHADVAPVSVGNLASLKRD